MGTAVKVCVVTSSFPRDRDDYRGVFLLRLFRAVREQGVDVVVVAPQEPDGEAAQVMDGIEVHRFRYWYNPRRHALATGVGVLPNLRNGWLPRFQVPTFAAAMIRATVKHARHADLIHSCWTPAAIAGQAAAWRWGCPHVIMPCGSDIWFIPKRFNRLMFRLADAVLSSGETMGQVLAPLGARCEPIPEFPLDEERFRPRPPDRALADELGVNPGQPVVLFVGRMYDFKDPLTLVEATPAIVRCHPDAKVVFVGDGEHEAAMRRRIDELGLADRVILAGKRGDVERFHTLASVFCALSPYENAWPNTVAEAMMMRVPCVITDSGRSPAFFADGVDCLLARSRDAHSIASGVNRLLDDPALRQQLADKALGLFDRHHRTIEAAGRVMIECYQRIIDRRTARKRGASKAGGFDTAVPYTR
jgi:glycosyltransferase involved in cell wall biosynthesis